MEAPRTELLRSRDGMGQSPILFAYLILVELTVARFSRFASLRYPSRYRESVAETSAGHGAMRSTIDPE